jgi:hypothetical protein
MGEKKWKTKNGDGASKRQNVLERIWRKGFSGAKAGFWMVLSGLTPFSIGVRVFCLTPFRLLSTSHLPSFSALSSQLLFFLTVPIFYFNLEHD